MTEDASGKELPAGSLCTVVAGFGMYTEDRGWSRTFQGGEVVLVLGEHERRPYMVCLWKDYRVQIHSWGLKVVVSARESNE